MYSKLGNYHFLCINKDISVQVGFCRISVQVGFCCISDGGRVWGATLNLSDCCLKFRRLTQVGMRVAAKSLCQQGGGRPGWCRGSSLPGGGGGSSSRPAVWEGRWGEGGGPGRQVSAWGLCAAADFIAARLTWLRLHQQIVLASTVPTKFNLFIVLLVERVFGVLYIDTFPGSVASAPGSLARNQHNCNGKGLWGLTWLTLGQHLESNPRRHTLLQNKRIREAIRRRRWEEKGIKQTATALQLSWDGGDGSGAGTEESEAVGDYGAQH